ncbi:MAG: hypothetical protein MZV63_38565 [Marinilabiliales bacterium]|nr:hypothetical protein [Marinilabiliales bacterium]
MTRLTWEQTTPETFQVYVNLKTEEIWGYDIKPSRQEPGPARQIPAVI